jgi:carboxypeptidase Q
MKTLVVCCVVCVLIVLFGCGGEKPVPDPISDLTTNALSDDFAWTWLADLCDLVGPRLSGSPAMDRAAAYSVETLEDAGFDRVWTEPVSVPRWVRGTEWAKLTAPVEEPLEITGLGTCSGTPPEGIDAEVLVVHDFDELESAGGQVEGKIVLFNPEWSGYGSVARYRTRGPQAAARLGAVAALVRSATGFSLGTLHTGVTTFEEGAPRIPAAAITTESADRIDRLTARGETVAIRLSMEAENHPMVVQSTVLAEVRGSELPNELVVAGCHLDSWDVGTGAHDDGAGCAIVIGAARMLLDERWRPRRTIRVVLFASEEFGGHSGRAYLERHRDELDRHVAALESDSGSFAPAGFSVKGSPEAVVRVAELAAGLENLGAAEVSAGGAGVDIGPIVEMGVPGIGHRVHNDRYFDYHHSPADTLDKVDPEHLAANVAAVSGLLWAIANEPESLPRSTE